MLFSGKLCEKIFERKIKVERVLVDVGKQSQAVENCFCSFHRVLHDALNESSKNLPRYLHRLSANAKFSTQPSEHPTLLPKPNPLRKIR